MADEQDNEQGNEQDDQLIDWIVDTPDSQVQVSGVKDYELGEDHLLTMLGAQDERLAVFQKWNYAVRKSVLRG